jgi:hypothetical protein
MEDAMIAMPKEKEFDVDMFANDSFFDSESAEQKPVCSWEINGGFFPQIILPAQDIDFAV